MIFPNRISSSTSCSIWPPETSPPSSSRDVLRHRLQSCNTSIFWPYGKYRLLERELTAQFGNMPVNGISVDELSKYRESWELSGISSQKKVERLRTFFRFCMDRNWCEKNPASKLSLPMFIRPQVQPFSDDEMGKILESVERYPDRPPGRRNEVRAFVSVIRSSGLRLGTW